MLYKNRLQLPLAVPAVPLGAQTPGRVYDASVHRCSNYALRKWDTSRNGTGRSVGPHGKRPFRPAQTSGCQWVRKRATVIRYCRFPPPSAEGSEGLPPECNLVRVILRRLELTHGACFTAIRCCYRSHLARCRQSIRYEFPAWEGGRVLKGDEAQVHAQLSRWNAIYAEEGNDNLLPHGYDTVFNHRCFTVMLFVWLNKQIYSTCIHQ